MENKVVIQGAALVAAGAIAGFTTGYFLSKKKFEKFANQEIESVKAVFASEFDELKDSYQKLHKEGAYSTPEGAVEALQTSGANLSYSEPEITEYVEEVDTLGYSTVSESIDSNEKPETVTNITVNVFDTPQSELTEDENEDDDGEWKPTIRHHEPYVITESDYMTTKDEWDKLSMTYYEGDDQLTDDQEHVVPDVDGTVGPDALEHFGYGTSDKNVVYVRNPRISVDIEIVRDTRSYQEVVLGVRPERVKSSPRRMREGDDG